MARIVPTLGRQIYLTEMIRLLTFAMFLCSTILSAQTSLKITNLTISEKEEVRSGPDVTASLKGDEGSKRLVLFADQDLEITGSFKVKSHNVARSSMKNSAVYLTMDLKLKTGGKTDSREVQKVFYMEDKRQSEFSEKFVVKRGVDTRVITVKFTGEIE